MKTLLKASGIGSAIAFMSAIGLVGCSAEPLSPEEAADIGSTSEALSIGTSTANPGDLSAGQGRFLHGACAFRASNTDYSAIFGGYDGTGAPLSTILVSKGIDSSATWVTPDVNGETALATALGDLQAFRIDDTHCALIGGSSSRNTTDVATVTLVTFSLQSNDVTKPRIDLDALHSLNAARSKHQMSTCVDNGATRIVVFGGGNNTAELSSIEVSPTLANITNPANAWTTLGTGMSVPRFNFGLAKDPSRNAYFLAAGNSDVAARENSIEAIKLTSACAFDARALSNAPLANGLEGNAVMFDANTGTTATFVTAAGIKAATTLNDVAETVTVTWNVGTPTFGSVSSVSKTLSFRATVADDGTNRYLIGGFNGAQNAGINDVEKYTPGTGFSSVALGASLFGAGAVYHPSAATPEVIVTSGTTNSTFTLSTSVIAVIP